MTAIGRSRRSGLDRVGGTRLTGLGAALLLVVIVGGANPPPATDRQILVLVWTGMVAVLVIGIVWPLVAIRRVGVSVVSPRDATVGEQVPLTVTISGRVGPCEVRALDPSSAWHRTTGSAAGTIGHLADRRGVFRLVRIEVRVTAPLGVLAAHRVIEAPLAQPVEIAPRPLAVDWQPAAAPLETGADHVALSALGGDLVRAVRPYAPGDPAHLVHWPSTARTGTLVVRELEPPAPVGQAVVVDLRDLGADKERAASYALGAARAVLAAGGELVLCTSEVAGPVTGRVRTPLEAGRRLARAVAAQPGTPPDGWPVVEIGR
ncbi:MAG: hypothetical protein JWO77_503 [Ilumatobacteraceae bacterium]|nr:hypothetical protein [Ilumatobacteraceae bacterium]